MNVKKYYIICICHFFSIPLWQIIKNINNNMETLELKQLRTRFVSDLNLPIQVVQDPYFTQRLQLLEKEYGAYTKYNELINYINEDYDGNANRFLETYHYIRDNIITTCEKSKAYKEFIENDKYKSKQIPRIEKKNLYIEPNDNECFISFDMKKANFQALKYAAPELVYNSDTYEDFIGNFTTSQYIKESKYTRQVIFGKLNPKRTINVESYLINIVYDYIVNNTNILEFAEPYSMNVDEIIFHIKKDKVKSVYQINVDSSKIKANTNIDIRITLFKLHHHQFAFATSNARLNVFQKVDLITQEKTLACVPSTYYPQVFKALNGFEKTEDDLVFYYEHELVSFKNPLKLIK